MKSAYWIGGMPKYSYNTHQIIFNTSMFKFITMCNNLFGEATMKFPKSILAMALLAVSSSTFSFEAKPYFGIEVGSTKVDNASGPVAASFVTAVGGTATATQNTTITATQLVGGYKATENVDVELAYANSSKLSLNFNGVSSGSVAYAGAVGMKISGFSYSVNLRPSVSTGFNGAFLKIGGHNFDADLTTSLSSGSASIASSSTISGSGTLFGIGYDIPLDNASDVRVSWTKYNKIAGESEITAKFLNIGYIRRF
jgi:hypothetical protein